MVLAGKGEREMSDTPLTDANALAVYDDGKPQFVSVGFARQLERALRSACEMLQTVDDVADGITVDDIVNYKMAEAKDVMV